MKCTMCGGCWHEASGHWVSEKRHWCGRCTREMIDMLKGMLSRKWGGVRFYDTALDPIPLGLNDPALQAPVTSEPDAV